MYYVCSCDVNFHVLAPVSVAVILISFAARRSALARHLLWRRCPCTCECLSRWCIVPKMTESIITRLSLDCSPVIQVFPYAKYEPDSSRASNGRGLGKSRKIRPIRRWAVCQRLVIPWRGVSVFLSRTCTLQKRLDGSRFCVGGESWGASN